MCVFFSLSQNLVYARKAAIIGDNKNVVRFSVCALIRTYVYFYIQKKCCNGANCIKHMDDMFCSKQKEMTPIKFSKCHQVQNMSRTHYRDSEKCTEMQRRRERESDKINDAMENPLEKQNNE